MSGVVGDGACLRVGFLNVNSLKLHIQEIRHFLHNDSSFHLFEITESKLVPVVDDYLVCVDG